MADISTAGNDSFRRLPRMTSYVPSVPSKIPEAAVSYARATNDAPITALMGVVVGSQQTDRHPVTSRCRVRNQVGLTNRWRLPHALGSDLLGSSQALKAIITPYNKSMIHIMTAESPKLSLNLDLSQPYKFRQCEDRPHTYFTGPRYEREAVPRLGSSLRQASTCTAPTSTFSAKPARITPIKKYIPGTARPISPREVFQYHSNKGRNFTGPDVLLTCMRMDWELHRPFLRKSETLSELIKVAGGPTPHKYYRGPQAETLDSHVKKSKFYSNEYRSSSSHKMMVVEKSDFGAEDGARDRKSIDNPSLISTPRINNVTTLQLHIRDPLVTKHALAVALGNLYHDDLDIEVEDCVGVMAAANALGFNALREGCANIMLSSMSYRIVCSYYEAAIKYHEDQVTSACERWLEMNLISELSTHIQLRDLPIDLLQKTIKSNRLFTFNEYSVYKTLSYWLFLHMNSDLQLMPSHSTVLSFFNSLPKSCSLLEREEGQLYEPLFASLRLHGITDTNHLRDMQLINVVPQSWIIDVLSQHYQALQGGGDMSAFKNFAAASIRQGFVVDEEPHYHSEILSLHGFHFELKAVKQSKRGSYSFFMQRLRPNDPILSFRQCERHTFSMRPDRTVNYCVRVQHMSNDGKCSTYNTGVLSQKFGLGDKISRSEVITLESLETPIHVTFAVLFPSS